MSSNMARGLPAYQRYPAKVLIPLMPDSDTESLMRLARWLSQWEPVLLVGIVPIPEGENLSVGAVAAHQLRRLIEENTDRVNLRARARIRVSYAPWDEVKTVLAKEPTIELMVLNWPQQLEAMRLSAAELLSHPPCDVIVVRGPFPEKPASILVPMRGGPHAERALGLALELSRSTGARVTALHLLEPGQEGRDEDTFAGMAQVLAELPAVRRETIVTGEQMKVILEKAADFDVVILGTVAAPTQSTFSFGMTMDAMLERAGGGGGGGEDEAGGFSGRGQPLWGEGDFGAGGSVVCRKHVPGGGVC